MPCRGLWRWWGGWVVERAAFTERDIRPREGFLVVALSWLVIAGLGGTPFVLMGVLDPINAYFEAMSGFTTTGATVIAHVEGLPRALLLWRAFTQWLGGMGIIVLAVALLPKLGVGGSQLMDAEAPGPTLERLTPRIRETARLLWGIYVGLTALDVLLLVFVGRLGWFDAVAHAFTTLSHGGVLYERQRVCELFTSSSVGHRVLYDARWAEFCVALSGYRASAAARALCRYGDTFLWGALARSDPRASGECRNWS
jgi:hypothetical protein